MRILEGLGIDGSRSHVGSLCDIEHVGIVNQNEGNSSPKPSHNPTKLGHALLNEKSCDFIVFDATRGDSLDIDVRCMQWPWWKADCHRYGSHRGFLMNMFCFTSCQSDMFFSKKTVHLLLLLLLWSFFQVCYFYFLTIRLQASSFPHTSLLITGIRY